ncbi:MAG: hypothetical protein WAW41_10680 [Methylobacter sp.]
MAYSLAFKKDALKEWHALDDTVRDTELIVVVVAIGKRERNAVYKAAAKR